MNNGFLIKSEYQTPHTDPHPWESLKHNGPLSFLRWEAILGWRQRSASSVTQTR